MLKEKPSSNEQSDEKGKLVTCVRHIINNAKRSSNKELNHFGDGAVDDTTTSTQLQQILSHLMSEQGIHICRRNCCIYALR